MASSSSDKTNSSLINEINEKLDAGFNEGESHVEAGIYHLMVNVFARGRLCN